MNSLINAILFHGIPTSRDNTEYEQHLQDLIGSAMYEFFKAQGLGPSCKSETPCRCQIYEPEVHVPFNFRAQCELCMVDETTPVFMIRTLIVEDNDERDFDEYYRSIPTILLSHGNAETIETTLRHAFNLSMNYQCNVCIYDYEGYGQNSVKESSEYGCYNSIEAAYDYLTDNLEHSPESIFLYGFSLGSGPTCYLAESLSRAGIKLGGVILEGAFSSVLGVISNSLSFITEDKFKNYKRVQNITCPILLIHGEDDMIVRFKNAIVLKENIDKKLLTFVPIKNGGHCKGVRDTKQYDRAMSKMLFKDRFPVPKQTLTIVDNTFTF